jgi:hypothetical protein
MLIGTSSELFPQLAVTEDLSVNVKVHFCANRFLEVRGIVTGLMTLFIQLPKSSDGVF